MDCWLEVSGHPEGSEAGQLHQCVLRFSLVLEGILCFYPNSTLHCMLLTQHPLPHKKLQIFRPKAVILLSIFFITQSVKYKIQHSPPVLSTLLHAQYTSHCFTFLISQPSTISPACLSNKDERAVPRNFSKPSISLFPSPIINVVFH